MAKGQYKRWRTEEGSTLLRGWRRSGMTYAQIAQKIGISEGTLYEWQSKYSEIKEALKKGKELCDFEAEEALQSLFKEHYVTDEITEIYEVDGVQKKHIKKTKRCVGPSATAIIFYLKCRAKWNERAAEAEKTEELAKLAYNLMKEEEDQAT